MNLTLESHHFYVDTLLLLYLLYSYIFFFINIFIYVDLLEMLFEENEIISIKLALIRLIFYLIEKRKINFKF